MSRTPEPRAVEWQQQFGTRLRELRKSQGTSQMALALRADLDPTYISAIEQGRRNVGLVNIRVLAEALGVSTAELFANDSSGRDPRDGSA